MSILSMLLTGHGMLHFFYIYNTIITAHAFQIFFFSVTTVFNGVFVNL